MFYRELLIVWVVSIAAFLASLAIGRTKDGENYITWRGSALLLIPTVLLLSEVLGIGKYLSLILTMEWVLLLGSIPYIGFYLVAGCRARRHGNSIA